MAAGDGDIPELCRLVFVIRGDMKLSNGIPGSCQNLKLMLGLEICVEDLKWWQSCGVTRFSAFVSHTSSFSSILAPKAPNPPPLIPIALHEPRDSPSRKPNLNLDLESESEAERGLVSSDPAIKAHVRRLLSPGQPTCDETDSSKISHEATTLANNPRPVSSSNDEDTEPRKPGTPELPGGSPQEPTGATQYTTRSNGSYSDASGSSELEALLPPVDSFKEEERAQWEPLSGDKFSRQKNTPRFEAYMMTGDLMLNLSRTQQSSGLLPKHQKKVDSLSTSPVGISKRESGQCPGQSDNSKQNAASFGYSSGFVRTSRSEDHLQFQKDPSMSAVDIDIDDDVTSSLNTLLDTRPDSGQGLSSERIVWTYNAPVSSPSASERTSCCQNGSSSQSSSSSSSTEGTSPQRSLSPTSPTSVSSSVMSSNSGSRRFPPPVPTGTSAAALGPSGDGTTSSASGLHPTNGDLSQSEAISNMSSPDYNDEETMDILSARDIMMVSDPSDSDSTILASEPPQRRLKTAAATSVAPATNAYAPGQENTEHRIVIQVKGPDKDAAAARNTSPRQNRRRGNLSNPELVPTSATAQSTVQRPTNNTAGNVTPEFVGYQELKESEDENEALNIGCYEDKHGGASPPQSADEESDIESLHSFHYSPKAVDLPSAVRLAKRLYSLDGFKKSDVSRHLSKKYVVGSSESSGSWIPSNDFSRAVAEEYLRYFSFERDTLDVALRKFLAQFSLTGETQERERVLVHFSKRFLDCNPGAFKSQDAVHTLTCAIMLLNTDLHGQNISRKMSCNDFIENLSGMNDHSNFPREVLKQLYNAIKSFPLEWALDEEGDETANQAIQQGDGPAISGTGNPFLDVPNITGATEFKKGYVMRKCCFDSNGKKISNVSNTLQLKKVFHLLLAPFGKRGWKMYYCTLRELVLYLHKDEHGFRNDSLHNAIRIHHALATIASDYTKKEHVFRLQTADQAEYLFQTSDSKELQSWIDTINFVCASFSCQPLAEAVGSQRKFQRPLLPCSHTKLSPREQLRDHEERVNKLEAELEEHRRHPPERGAKALTVQNYKEKDAYLHHELKRYKTYAYLLRSRLAFTEMEPSLVESCIGEVDEGSGSLLNSDVALVPPPVPDRPAINRYSYRAAIYNRNLLNGQDYGGDIG
ncbi:PH and SEC7 domain-containing protein 3 [Eufriesea mexicana]|uniref:PH and SEC7 domain-containing protein 3 n=1 Tax=Eufriesea mexicana TaxID=516756 RepID=A0A310SU03_9HYME|nr:PH and SEC7 domain-containing protein 3 [Eufriesea mexicana]